MPTLYLFVTLFVLCSTALMVLLHPLKQSLHDLLVDSVVVRKGMFSKTALDSLQNPRAVRRAYAICTTVFFVLAAFLSWGLYGMPWSLYGIPQFSDQRMPEIEKSIERDTQCTNAEVDIHNMSRKIFDKSGQTKIDTSIDIMVSCILN